MSETSNFSMKELYEVRLKTTYPMEYEGRKIQSGEVIAFFDKIQISNFKEIKECVTANGGFDNRPHVFWESTKEVRVCFSQGVFSKSQFALMAGAKLLKVNDSSFPISKRELKETDENGKIYLEEMPATQPFVYNKNGEKVEYILEENVITTDYPFSDLIVDYTYLYNNNATYVTIGQRAISGFLELEGKTRYKDDKNGLVKTAIIKIPKLKLMSDLSMSLGKDAVPLVGVFDAIAIPTGVKGRENVMQIVFLNDDIDSDM